MGASSDPTPKKAAHPAGGKGPEFKADVWRSENEEIDPRWD
jgi:hypothetical protein